MFIFLCPFDLQYLLVDSCTGNWIYPLCQLVRFLIYQFMIIISGFIFFVNCLGSLCQWGGAEESRRGHQVQGLPCQVRSEWNRSTDWHLIFALSCVPFMLLCFTFISCIFTLLECWCTLPKKCFKCYGVSSINLCWIFSNRSHDGLFPR